MTSCQRCGTGLALSLVCLGWATSTAWSQEPKATNDDLKGATKKVGGADVTELKVQAKGAPRCMMVDKDGKALYFLKEGGLLRRISLEGFKEEARLDIGKKSSWLSLSAEGLLVTVADAGEIWVLDPVTLKQKKKIAFAGVARAVSAPSLSIAFAVSGKGAGQGDALAAIGLQNGRVLKQYNKKEFGKTQLTEDKLYFVELPAS